MIDPGTNAVVATVAAGMPSGVVVAPGGSVSDRRSRAVHVVAVRPPDG